MNQLIDHQSNYQKESSDVERRINLSERSCVIAGLPAFESYQKVKLGGISSDIFFYSAGVISEKHDRSFQLFMWGNFEAYTKGIAEKIAPLIASTFKILEE